MKPAYGLNIPQTLREICDPQRIALVYDMQVGILSPIKNADQVTQQVSKSSQPLAMRACVCSFRATYHYQKN
jgi:hypothetical protein